MASIALIPAFFFLASTMIGGSRVVQSLNDDWKFVRQDEPDAKRESLDDTRWSTVSLPHTWNALDGQDGGNDYYRGIGWYRKTFTLGHEYSGKSLFLKFDGASSVARVFLNGTFAGEHKGSFGAFCVDVSHLVVAGGRNVIAVQVSNARDSTIAPLRGDFTIFGGLYRGVYLLSLNTVSIAPDDYASSGVYVRQKEVSRQSATLEVMVRLRNAGRAEKNLQVLCSVLDKKGAVVAQEASAVVLKAMSHESAAATLTMSSPRLWNGVRDPYLYTLRVDLQSGSEHLDRVVEKIGLRFFSVDAAKGFFLNGEPHPLHGVSRHQDRENKGWAIGAEEHREDFALIREMGCNAVRLAHYQQAKEFYSLCDSGGIAVWAELALVDFVNNSPAFLDNVTTQLMELIKQNYNHPSILCWGLFNELIPNEDEALYDRIVRHLNNRAKELDPTRLTASASRSAFDGSVGINRISDLLGYNVYRGWYEPDPAGFATFMDDMHNRFPELRLAVGEYGAGAGIHSHEFPAKLHDTRGKWHPEEWQATVHETVWNAIAEREYLWGSFVWNMFDFASDSRAEGEFNGRNDKGLVTFDRKTRKDAFFWYKANWNAQPMVHLTEKRFTPRPVGRVTVKVYSNCRTVDLFLDGKSLGRNESNDRVFLWNDVDLKAGEHVVTARALDNTTVIADSCVWRVE